MKIRLIDFGLTPGHNPLRVHENDAGADVYMPYDCTIKPGEIVKIPLGFGLILPDGYAGFVFPRSSMAEKPANYRRLTPDTVERSMPSSAMSAIKLRPSLKIRE